MQSPSYRSRMAGRNLWHRPANVRTPNGSGDGPSKAKRVQGRECLAERNEAKPTIRCSRHRTVRERPSHFVRRPASVRNSKHRTPNLKRGDTMRLRSMEVPNQRLRSPAAMEIRLGQRAQLRRSFLLACREYQAAISCLETAEIIGRPRHRMTQVQSFGWMIRS